MRVVILFIFSIILFSACKEKSSLEAEVLAIHDEVMPRMGEIHVAKKKLKKVISETKNDSIKTEILTLINNLEKADEGMMDWMHNWEVPIDNPEKDIYLLSEKAKISKVKKDMQSSIEAANQFISKSSQ